jgi:hypothetical protein
MSIKLTPSVEWLKETILREQEHVFSLMRTSLRDEREGVIYCMRGPEEADFYESLYRAKLDKCKTHEDINTFLLDSRRLSIVEWLGGFGKVEVDGEKII